MDVILLGASTRAAAVSARRAGWTPWCADLFADADLQRIAAFRKVALETYPRGLLDALADAPPGPVVYTGALENWPNLIACFSEPERQRESAAGPSLALGLGNKWMDRPLWGNPLEVLRAIRSPERWTRFLLVHGIGCPRISVAPTADGPWLLKPRKSAGGLGIHDYARQAFKPRTHFLQERIDGSSCSAVYLGTSHLGGLLLGVTRQLVGVPWLNASGYQYCGNIGPLALNADARAKWQHIGAALTLFPLHGLFGVDAIVADGTVWPVEINPRYTASMELLERSYSQPLLPMHRAAFEQTPLPSFRIPPSTPIWGKAILYAKRTFAFPADGPWLDSLGAGVDLDRVEYADIPHSGEVIEQGHPVLTLFASSATVDDCETKLQEMATALDRRLWG